MPNITDISSIVVPAAAINAVIPTGNLDRTYRWNSTQSLGTGVTVNYYFSNARPSYENDASYVADRWNDDQKTIVRSVLDAYARVANLTFVEVNSEAVSDMALFLKPSIAGAAGVGTYPSTNTVKGNAWGDVTFATNSFSTFGNVYLAYHEIAHAMGIAHFTQADAGKPTNQTYGLPAGRQFSVADYTGLPRPYYVIETSNSATLAFLFNPEGPSILDIAALQALYGANNTTANGDDVYRFDVDPNMYRTIWDGGGNDTIDVSNQAHSCLVSLVPGTFSTVGYRDPLALVQKQWVREWVDSNIDRNLLNDGANNLAIAFNATIENVLGSSADDILIGNAAANRLSGNAGDDTIKGGEGNDTLDGGAGFDTASYEGQRASYVIQRAGQGYSVRNVNGADGTDTITNVERLTFADQSILIQYSDVVQALYVAYFGRAADPGGWANFQLNLKSLNAGTDIQSASALYAASPTMQALVDAFGNSAESRALYTGDTRSFVTAIYSNVLNRGPAQQGLDFWSDAIDSGRLSRGNAALSIMAGALTNTTDQGLRDAALVTNKIHVASNFTLALNSAERVSAYSGSSAASTVRSMLAGVSGTTTVEGFQQTVDATVTALRANRSPNGPESYEAGVTVEFVGVNPEPGVIFLS